MHMLFSESWLASWKDVLNANEAYRDAAQQWEWPLVLTIQADDVNGSDNPALHAYLDLWHGECREARPGTDTDLENVPYAISGMMQTWEAVLKGEVDPLSAIMRGKLVLEKGNMFALAKYGTAAKHLVLSARDVPTQFADGSGLQNGGELVPQPTVNAEPSRQKTTHFVSTSAAGLSRDSFPMQLFAKAKKFGIWNPDDIDFSQDSADWKQLTELESEVLLHLTSLFQAGEESVVIDLLPLMMVLAKEGRLEEEMYLTSFLWEEAKHVDFFQRYLQEVIVEPGDLARFHTPNYSKIFYEELPAAMSALLTDSSPSAQIRASVTYNMIVEGTLAETGYHAYFTMLEENDIMPGLRQGIQLLKQDESRHIAFGIYLLSRLVKQHPALMAELNQHMERLLEIALGAINEIFDRYEVLPFGLKLETFIDFATDQYSKRMERIERGM